MAANIFTLENISDFSEKINIDELYERKKQHDIHQLNLYNKLLNRIHVRIKTTARQKMDEQFCWFVVPEIMIGVPKYDQGACIGYLLEKLKDNGFAVRYIHPNTLFICWKHFVPSYVRSELKKKMGIVVDEYGKRVDSAELEDGFANASPANLDEIMLNSVDSGGSINTQKQKKNYTPIKSYKPQGNLIYNEDLLNTLEGKFQSTF
jgi:hypothetical protein